MTIFHKIMFFFQYYYFSNLSKTQQLKYNLQLPQQEIILILVIYNNIYIYVREL